MNEFTDANIAYALKLVREETITFNRVSIGRFGVTISNMAKEACLYFNTEPIGDETCREIRAWIESGRIGSLTFHVCSINSSTGLKTIAESQWKSPLNHFKMVNTGVRDGYEVDYTQDVLQIVRHTKTVVVDIYVPRNSIFKEKDVLDAILDAKCQTQSGRIARITWSGAPFLVGTVSTIRMDELVKMRKRRIAMLTFLSGVLGEKTPVGKFLVRDGDTSIVRRVGEFLLKA